MCQGPSLCGALPRPHPEGPQQCAHVVRCSCKTCLQKGKSAVVSTGGPALCLNPLPGCFCAFSHVQGVMSTRGVWRLRKKGSWIGEACSWGHGICLWGSRSHLCRVKWPGAASRRVPCFHPDLPAAMWGCRARVRLWQGRVPRGPHWYSQTLEQKLGFKHVETETGPSYQTCKIVEDSTCKSTWSEENVLLSGIDTIIQCIK